MNHVKTLKNRRGMTGLETAIILVAFVITAAAFAFVVLNMGFLTAEKAQSVISSGMSEAASALLTDSGIVGQFSNVTGDQSDICLTKLTFYLKLSQGHEPIDLDDSVMVATYTNQRCHGDIYSSKDFTDLAIDGVDPAVTAGNRPDLYAHPYEEFRIELRPSAGAVLTVERQIPAVHSTVMVIE